MCIRDRFADDEIFWRILDLEYEEQSKLKMRLHGAFRAPFLRVLNNVLEIKDWSPEDLQKKFTPTLHDVENNLKELIAKIQSEQDHLKMIDNFIEEYFRQHPRSTDSSPYVIQILSAIRTGQWPIAEDIIRQRLASGKISGISTEKGTFFEVAYQYLHSIGRTSPEEAPMVIESQPIRPNFEAMEKSVSDMMAQTIDNFGESDESIYWVEVYLMDTEPDSHAKSVTIFGAWLGQFLVRQFEGTWSKSALGWGVSIGPGTLRYPYVQVEKYPVS